MFLMKAQAARSGINRVLSTLSAMQPALLQPITIHTLAPGPPLQYAPDPVSFAAAPAQARAVLTSTQVKQDLAWQSTLVDQVGRVTLLCACKHSALWCGHNVTYDHGQQAVPHDRQFVPTSSHLT